MIVFDGKKVAGEMEEELRERVEELKMRGINPKLVWICSGDDEASLMYGRLKGKAAERVGILFEQYRISNIKYQKHVLNDVINEIRRANEDPKVHGVMVQLPLSVVSSQLSVVKVLSAIDPVKDVDCLTAENLGRVMMGEPRFLPATVGAVITIIQSSKLKIQNEGTSGEFVRGKRIVVVGGGLEVGKPLVNHLSNLGATVLWARSSAEQNLGEYTRWGEIIISAVGKAGLIRGEMVSGGIVAIDVGSPKGDFEFESVKEKALFITPVPGGVGPVTVASLMENVVEAAERSL